MNFGICWYPGFLRICFFILIPITLGCNFPVQKKKLIVSSDEYAIFLEDHFPSFILPVVPELPDGKPIQIKDLTKILASLKIDTNSLLSRNQSIAKNSLTEEIAGTICNPKCTENKLYEIVIRTEDILNPITRIFRTRFYLFMKGNHIVFYFGEVMQSVNFQGQYNFSDWGILPQFGPDTTNDGFEVELSESSPFHNDKIGWDGKVCGVKDKDNKNQKPCPGMKVDLSRPRKTLETDKPKIHPDSPEVRLKRLKDLFDKKLISEDEYKAKRTDILKQL